MKMMALLVALVVSALALSAGGAPLQAQQTPEARFALVIGNDGYTEPLPTAANDAGLIADTLGSAGFDVTGARNLDLATLRAALKEFVDKIAEAGPGSVALIYLSGIGVQFDGENYFLPIGAESGQAADVPNTAISFAEIRASLGVLRAKARIVVFDAAYASPFTAGAEPSAGGLALNEPTDGELIAFNAAPGTVASPGPPPYGVYATALAEMIRTGGLPLGEVFDRVRLRVADVTHGDLVPFDLSRVKQTFEFFALAAAAPRSHALPHRKASAAEAYSAAIAADTLDGYLEYLSAFPNSAQAPRIRAIVAARREALTWLRSASLDTPEAYWSYLRRYPRGPHRFDARRRLGQLSAELSPPPDFDAIDYGDLPPPSAAEFTYLERHPYVSFEDENFAPPPPVPEDDLPPPPVWWALPPPPPPVFAPFFLPAPRPFASPAYLAPPRYVRPAPPPPIYVQAPSGVPNGQAPVVAGAAAAAVAFRLPSVVQSKIQHDHKIFVTKASAPGAGAAPLMPGQPIPGVPGVAKGIRTPTRPSPGKPAAEATPLAPPPPAAPKAAPLPPPPAAPKAAPPPPPPAAPKAAAPPPPPAAPKAAPPPPPPAAPKAAPPPPPPAAPKAAAPPPPPAAPKAAAPPPPPAAPKAAAPPPPPAAPKAAPPPPPPAAPKAPPPPPPPAAPKAAAPPPPPAAPKAAPPPPPAAPKAPPPPPAAPKPAPPPPAAPKAAPPPPAAPKPAPPPEKHAPKPERKDCGHPGQPAC
jgi:uncharacterized caspase-like protein